MDDNNSTESTVDKPTTQDYKEGLIGQRIHKLRLAKGYSQRKLAGLAGVTNSAISAIERNKVSPAINTLIAVLDVLDSDLSTFFSDNWNTSKTGIVVKFDELVEISESGSGVSIKQVYSPASDGTLGFLFETYAPHSCTEQSITHEGEEIGTVIEGEVTVYIEGTSYLLKTGDSYVINTNHPHTFANLSDTQARIISAHTPATY